MKPFDYEYLTRRHYHVISPKTLDNPAVLEIADTWAHANFYKLNYTLTLVTEAASGYADDSGNYSGLVGMLQRKEADFAQHMVLLGGIYGEPVQHGDVLTGADLHVYSTRGNATSRNTDLFDVMKSFNPVTLVYYFVLLHILCAILIFAIRKLDTRWSWSTYKDTCWSYLTLIIGQDSCPNKSWSQRLLWLHLSFSAFFLIFGFFLNLISTDSIAEIRPAAIDTMKDITGPDFSHTKFHILKQAFFYNYLKHAPGISPLRAIYKKLESNSKACKHMSDCSVLVFGGMEDGSSMQQMMIFLKQCAEGKSAILYPRQGVDGFLHNLGCRLEPSTTANLHRSRDKIASGLLTSFHRQGLDERVTRYTSYRLKRFTEMDIFQTLPTVYLEREASQTPVTPSDYYQCMEGFVEMPENDISATMNSFRGTLKLTAVLMSMSVVVLALELCRHLCRNMAARGLLFKGTAITPLRKASQYAAPCKHSLNRSQETTGLHQHPNE